MTIPLYSQPKSGLQSRFEQFKTRIELTQSQKDTIQSSHKHLREVHLQPLPYVMKSFLTGSYKRNTMIRPPSDVDAFVVLKQVDLKTSPYTVLKWLKRDLSDSYPNSEIRQNKPCIVLDFKHCKIELTPAIANQYFGSNYYIPGQGINGWSSTEDPRLAEERLSRANQRVNGMLTPLIKMMKFAKRHNKIDIKSYQIEEIATRSIYFMSSYRDGVQQMIGRLRWTVAGMQPHQLERLSDSEFGSLCR